MKKQEIKTKWDLNLIYKGPKDPQIENDLQEIELALDSFSKKYSENRSYLESSEKLLEALNEYEDMHERLPLSAPALYFYYRIDLNSKDNYAIAKKNLITSRMTKAHNKLIFFSLDISKIPEEKQKEYLADPKLLKYRYFLKLAFEEGKHNLSEAEEKIINLKAPAARQFWSEGVEKALSQKMLLWKGKSIPLPQAFGIFSDLSTKDRRELYKRINQKVFEVSDFAESEINAIYNDKKIEDELRKFPKSYSATVMKFENDVETVESLAKIVSDNFKISHEFYKIKAKLLKLNKLEYADRAAGYKKVTKEITFDEAVRFVGNVFEKINPEYKAVLDSFLKNGQIDTYPVKGKASGAYCSHGHKVPIYVLLNHTNDFHSLTTLAHEMGHAIHSHFSQINQPIIYQDYTTSTAEVASTFFENAVTDAFIDSINDKEKIAVLHDKIQNAIQTVFRQIACFNFEVELHDQIRTKGALPKEEISKLMNKHMKSYLGPAFQMTELDGYFFVSWSHIRRFFYVYTYAFGNIVSSAMLAEYKKDKKFEEKIRQFLSAGGSDSPENIFKNIGIDVQNPAFFLNGLNEIKKDIELLKKLTSK